MFGDAREGLAMVPVTWKCFLSGQPRVPLGQLLLRVLRLPRDVFSSSRWPVSQHALPPVSRPLGGESSSRKTFLCFVLLLEGAGMHIVFRHTLRSAYWTLCARAGLRL